MSSFRVAFVGAGQINFGSPEGPWNHSIRLEKKLGERLQVVALVEPFEQVSADVLKMKRASPASAAYKDTAVYTTVEEFISATTPETRPHAIWIGTPPSSRGSTQPGRNIEALLADGLPGVSLFVEKPISTSSVEETMLVSRYIADKCPTVSVGYMMRYLKAMQKMKQMITDNNLTVMAVNCRYVIAYELLVKQWWWNKELSLGPIIEQATHIVDLARHVGGEVEIDSIMAHTLEYFEKPAHLSKLAFDEDVCIDAEQRIPRVTSAMWKFDSGAVGSLMHVVALHGRDFCTDLDVYADGYGFRLHDLYNDPVLYVRRPGSDKEDEYRFEDDDPFYAEVSSMVDAVDDPLKKDLVLSSYDDAARTYALTWAIRLVSERQVMERAVRRRPTLP